jgi:heterodisulfide reductase subunit B
VTRRLAGLKPAAYYGCLLTRFPSTVPVPDSVENPQGMETICRALGAEPVEWGFKTDCCGASAAVNDTDQALLLMSRIIKDALARGANCFVTTCPMCQLNLDAYQDQVREKYAIRERLPVYLITELLGIAFGMNPAELQIDRHLEESVALLKELRLA